MPLISSSPSHAMACLLCCPSLLGTQRMPWRQPQGNMATADAYLRPHLTRDAGLFGHSSQPVQIRPHADSRFLAEHSRNVVWQDGVHVPEANPRAHPRGIAGTHPEG